LIERETSEVVECHLETFQVDFGALLWVVMLHVHPDVDLLVLAFCLEGRQALLGFLLVKLVCELGAEELYELSTGHFFVVEAVVEVLVDHLDFRGVQRHFVVGRVFDSSGKLLGRDSVVLARIC